MRATARVPVHAHEMLGWTAPLFEGESAEMRRMREASAFFSDVAWRRHPDDRAVGAFGQVLTAPFAGASHRARALIAAVDLPPLFRRRGFSRRPGAGGAAGQGRRKARAAAGPGLALCLFAVGLGGGRTGALPPAPDPVQGGPGSAHPARSHRRRAGAETAGRPGRCLGPQGRNPGWVRLPAPRQRAAGWEITAFSAWPCALAPGRGLKGPRAGPGRGSAGSNGADFKGLGERHGCIQHLAYC